MKRIKVQTLATPASAPPTATSTVVVRVEAEPKKRRKYSRGAKQGQKALRGVSRSALRISDAVTQALVDYRSRGERSARKRRDGELRDLPKNLSRALGTLLRNSSKAPYDLTRRLSSGRVYRPMRGLSKLLWG